MTRRRLIIEDAPSIVWAHSNFAATTGFTAAARTHALNLTSVVAGAYRQGVKADLGLGSNKVNDLWVARISVVFATAPTAGGSVDVFLGYSNDVDAGDNNPANLTGADAAWVGYGADAAAATTTISQLSYIGSMIVANVTGPQKSYLGVPQNNGRLDDVVEMHNTDFAPLGRFASPVVRNNASTDFANSAIQMSLQLFRVIGHEY